MSGLRAAIELLRREMRNARVKVEVDFHSMIIGSSSAFVDLYRYLFCDFDRDISLHLAANNFLLTGTTDRRFTEILYRICRDLLKINPPLSLTQFFTNSFAEKKLRMSAEIVKSVAELKSRLNKKPLSTSRMLKKTPGILMPTRSWMARRRTALSSKSSNLVARMAVQQKVTSNLTNSVPSSKLTLALQNDSTSQPKTDQSIQEPEYMSDLMTSLKTISNQISQIVDRMEGIELRVSAIEKPLRNANPEKNLSTVPERDGTKNNPEESLSDINSPVETTVCVSQPLFESVDRYPPEVTIFSSGDGIKMSRNSSTYTRQTFTASHSSERLLTLSNECISSCGNKSYCDGDAFHIRNVDLNSYKTKPVPIDYQSKTFGNFGLCKNNSFSCLNNKNDYSVLCNDSNNARFDADQVLEQQVNRISNMLAETQILLNSRRQIPHN